MSATESRLLASCMSSSNAMASSSQALRPSARVSWTLRLTASSVSYFKVGTDATDISAVAHLLMGVRERSSELTMRDVLRKWGNPSGYSSLSLFYRRYQTLHIPRKNVRQILLSVAWCMRFFPCEKPFSQRVQGGLPSRNCSRLNKKKNTTFRRTGNPCLEPSLV